MKRSTSVFGLLSVFAGLLLAGCAGGVPSSSELCQQECSCERAACGDEAICEQDYDEMRRGAARARCSAEYDDYVACLGGSSCSVLDDPRACNAEYRAYADCVDPHLTY